MAYEEATDFYAARGYEFRARYQEGLKARSGIDANQVLRRDRGRNQAYDFAETAWDQRNGFRNLLRELPQR